MEFTRPTCRRIVGSLMLMPIVAGAWTGSGASPGTYGYVVDTTNRNDVLSFYHNVYQASEGFETRTTNWIGGNYAAPYAEGTISSALVNDVERRVNYYRAMSGVPANVRFNTGSKVIIGSGEPIPLDANTTKVAASQRAALMMAVNHTIATGANPAFSHTPSNGCLAWTTAAWNANYHGNLSVGTYGPRSVDQYFKEDASNYFAGHRRWLLYLRGTNYATGDTPGSGSGPTATISSNNIYVVHRNEELDTTVPAKFVPYPGKGFFPAPLNTEYWSLGYPNADFSNAVVTMTPQGGAAGVISPVNISRINGYADNTIVWKVPAAAAVTYLNNDLTYQVTVSNIAGITGVTSYTYSVTLINPDRLLNPVTLTGSASPPVLGANYVFPSVPKADAFELAGFKVSSVVWTEGAEPGPVAPKVRSRTSPNYSFLSSVGTYNGTVASLFYQGTTAFRLTFGNLPVRDEMFELDRELVTGVSPKLKYSYRRGYMRPSTSLMIEQSNDGGGTWTNLQTITGNANGSADPSFTSVTDKVLTPGTHPIRVRFRLIYSGSGAVDTHFSAPTFATGIFIDGISTTGCQWLERSGGVEVTASTTQAALSPTVAGGALLPAAQYYLRARTKMGSNWFYYGLPKIVAVTASPLTGYLAWEAYDYPSLSGVPFNADSDGDGVPNGVEFAFSTNPLISEASSDTPAVDPLTSLLKITRPLLVNRTPFVTYTAEWSDNLTTWSGVGVVVTLTGGEAMATVPKGAGHRFLRWKIVKP